MAWFLFLTVISQSPAIRYNTDASLVAGAAYHNGDFLYSHWNSDLPNIASEPIYVKEMCAILLGGGGGAGGVPDHDSQKKKAPFHISRGK